MLRALHQQGHGLFGKMVNISLRRCQMGALKAQKKLFNLPKFVRPGI